MFRFRDAAGQLHGDVIGLENEALGGGEPLLTQVMAGGEQDGSYPGVRGHPGDVPGGVR